MAEAVKPRRAKAKASRTKGKVRMLSLPCEPSARRAPRGVPWGPVGSRCQGRLAGSLTRLHWAFAHLLYFPHQRLAACAEAAFSSIFHFLASPL